MDISIPWVDGDVWSLAVDLFTIISGLLALLAIVLSLGARRAAAEQLARERRLDFELDVLLELLDHVGELELPRYVARLKTLPREEVPICRWAAGLNEKWPTGSAGAAPVDQLPDVYPRRRPEWGWTQADGSFVRVPVVAQDELLAVIQRRIDQR